MLTYLKIISLFLMHEFEYMNLNLFVLSEPRIKVKYNDWRGGVEGLSRILISKKHKVRNIL
jgi:hypothetical protein